MAHLGDLLPSHEESNGDKERLRRRLLGGLLQLPPHTDLHDLLRDLELGQMLLLLQQYCCAVIDCVEFVDSGRVFQAEPLAAVAVRVVDVEALALDQLAFDDVEHHVLLHLLVVAPRRDGLQPAHHSPIVPAELLQLLSRRRRCHSLDKDNELIVHLLSIQQRYC